MLLKTLAQGSDCETKQNELEQLFDAISRTFHLKLLWIVYMSMNSLDVSQHQP